MPIIINDGLPAFQELVNENIFVLNNTAAAHQDIRPLKIAILNLMPNKIETELQILRLLSNCPLQIDIELLHPSSHRSKNTSQEHLSKFYKDFDDIKGEKFDGLIVTGAPIENMPFEQVDYWQELTEIFKWSDNNVYSSLHICWGAQAGLYYHYGVPKQPLPHKKFGVFKHSIERYDHALLRGFDDYFYCCQSRHTEVRRSDIEAVGKLEILSASEESGVNIAADRSGRRFFVFGHFEYDRYTLHREYKRDKDKGLDIQLPCNYYPGDNSDKTPVISWKAHANQLFSNWLNYFVYQETPYNTEQINRYLEFSGKAGKAFPKEAL